MKYLFYVQSHIAFYMSLLVQEYLKIPKDQVLYITVRNYKNLFHRIAPLDLSDYYDKLNSPMRLKEAIQAIKDIDNKISLLTQNDDYEFVTHSISPPVWQFIATNVKCKKIHIIEDGSSSYHKNENLYKLQTPTLNRYIKNKIKYIISRDFRMYLRRAPGFPIFGTEPLFKNTTYYGIYKDVFPFINENQKVIFGSLYKDPYYQSSINYNNSSILIFDATLVEQRKLMTEEEYLKFVSSCLEEFQNYNKNIYFKFHPGQNKNIVSKLRHILEKQYSAIELNPEIPIEQIIIQHKNLEFYGFFSTLLFYAKREGHLVKSFIENTYNDKIINFIQSNFNDYFIKEIFKLKS